MSTATERLPVLVTKDQKARIMKRAKAANLTAGEYLRRAAEAYQPQEDEKLLEGMIEQVVKSTAVASQALDRTMSFVADSQERIAQMEKAHKPKAVA